MAETPRQLATMLRMLACLATNLTQIKLLNRISAMVSLQRFINIKVYSVTMNRVTCKFVSLFSIVAIVFAQLAVAAYACPMQFHGLGDAGANLSASAPDASERDSASPALCKKHCENGQQNVNDSPQSPASAPFETAQAPTIATQLATPRDLPAAVPSLRHATAPPHSIRNCCFRI